MPDAQKTCRICRSPFQEHLLGEKNSYKLIACKLCGSVMAEPWPTQKMINNYYGDVQPEIVHLPSPQAEIQRLKKLLPRIAPDFAKRSFLDIDCRQGYAVVAAKELGFKSARGIDTYEFFVAFAKDKYDPHLFECISTEEAAAKGEQANLIFAVDSFCEHPDPEAHMAALSRMLGPQGILYIEEPDGNHFMLPRNFIDWEFVEPPLNFCYLSQKGLLALLARHGLKVRRKLFTWGPFMRLIVTRK
jgi:SAM-dependent methyltransferase